jgi:hypothetical protein
LTVKKTKEKGIEDLIARDLEVIQRYRLLPELEKRESKIQVKGIESSSEIRDLIAIDGSYSFILNLSSIWLAIVRVGALHYRYSEDKGYELIDHKVGENPVLVSTKKEVMENLGEMHGKLFEATRYASEQHREMVNQFRRLNEQEMAY